MYIDNFYYTIVLTVVVELKWKYTHAKKTLKSLIEGK